MRATLQFCGMTPRSGGVAVIAMAMAACVSPPAMRYTKPDTTQEEFMRDRYECLQDPQNKIPGTYGPVVSCTLLSACFGYRGYILDPHGNLAPPPGMIVPCY
jgi:hypothetical protein